MLSLALLAACQKPLREKVEPHTFAHQGEAGSGHVAVLSVAPWQDYIAAMKPGFELTPTQALQEVAPDTALLEDKLLDMLSVVMRVATPSSGTTTTKTEASRTATDAEGETTSTSERTREAKEEEKPGEAPEFKSSLRAERSAEKLPGLGDHGKGGLKQAALTHYSLATALLQEVQLLNRYVEDAVTRKGYRPYVVRLRVSLMPSVRTAPYDAYSTLSFLPADEGGACDPTVPAIVPLVVSDDMEAALASDSSETVRQLALALSAMIRGFSVNADVERYTDELVHTVTRNYNSLYTVARLTENTVRVRMGARLHSSREYFMVPQTHNVTLLLMAPPSWRPEKTVAVTSLTEFVNVNTGETLRGRTLEETGQKYTEFLQSFGLGRISRDDARKLAAIAGENDYGRFRSTLECLAGTPDADERTAQRLWAAFATATVGARWASTALSLPEICPCGLPSSCTWATGSDDRASSLTVELRPAHNVDRDKLGAVLILAPSETCLAEDKGLPAVRIAPTSVAYDRPKALLRFGFPSLAQIRHPSGRALDLVEARRLHVSLRLDDRNSACGTCAPGVPGEFPVSIVSVAKTAEAEEPVVSVVSLPAMRGCGCGDGKLVVRIGRKSRSQQGVQKVTLKCEFLSADGKSPASGALVSAKRGDAPLDVATALNLTTFTLKQGEGTAATPFDVELQFEQLADASSLVLAAGIEGLAGPEGTRKILVSVAGAGKCTCPPEEASGNPAPSGAPGASAPGK